MLTLLICFTAGGVAAEVSVKTYQSSNEGRLNKNQHARALKEYSKLPGTTLIGPKKSFTVRKIVYNTTPVSTMIATNTGGQNMRQIGRAIIEQTDCQIAQGTRVELITSFSGSGFAFFCSP